MASANTSWSEENLSCPICLDVFNNPVSTPCGHNFCGPCIKTLWDCQIQCKCPVCKELFRIRPVLRVNCLIESLVDQFRSGMCVTDQPCVDPGEVPCDVCTGTQLKAVKSCLVCFTSYCHTHLEPHQRVARLKKHLLVEPMDRLEDRMCKKHDRLLELFCQTEQVCVCLFCTETDHKSHPVVPLKQEYEGTRAKLQKMESEVQQMIHERKQKIQEIRDTVKLSKADADREIADGVKASTALKKLKSTEEQAEGLIKELEQEIKDLTNRSSEVKHLSHTEDHLRFLQAFRSLKNPPPTRAWTTVEIQPPAHVGPLRSLDQPEEPLRMEKLCGSPSVDPNGVCRQEPGLIIYACELTVDLNTAHRELSLSEDNRKVTRVLEKQSYPDHPERFDYWQQVLCREALTGRCYWEVERDGYVSVGVTYRGITRRGRGGDSRLGWNNKSWSLFCYYDGCYTARYNGIDTDIHLPPPVSNRVGVHLDQPAGTLSFYRVIRSDVGGSSDTLTHIHTFQSTFTQVLYPAFGFGTYSSVSLGRV